MELLSSLSDDQMALLGCATALVSTGSLMCLSYFIGRGRIRQLQRALPVSAAQTLGVADATGATTAQPSKQRTAA